MTMHFDWSTFGLQTINFVVLVWLLQRFLYRPVLRLVDARRAEIDRQYGEARGAETRAREELAAVAAARAGIAAEREAALKAAAAQAEAAATARHAEAEHDADELLDNVRKALAAERKDALAEARRVAVDLAAVFAERLSAELPAELRSVAWCEQLGQCLAALPRAERDNLVRQLADGTHLNVVTAQPLPPAAAEAWRSRLQTALGTVVAIDFAVDAGLIAGADLHFPNAVLHFSWQAALAAMRDTLDADGIRR
jgi:F-type H+-transporting ATPase subunit b